MITETERLEVEKDIRDAIGWALTKDIDRLFSIMAQDDDFFIFHPDSKSTILGFEAFKKFGERVWMKDAFKATDFAVKDLRLKFAELGNVAWYSCMLDDHAEWNGQPIGWDNCRWTGTLEKRGQPMDDRADAFLVPEGLTNKTNHKAISLIRQMALFPHDSENNVADLTGSTYRGYLYVGRLWTDQRLRQARLGCPLLKQAEQEALQRGCHSAHLITGNFNALPFYMKRGYDVFGELNDMPPGHPQYLSPLKMTFKKTTPPHSCELGGVC